MKMTVDLSDAKHPAKYYQAVAEYHNLYPTCGVALIMTHGALKLETLGMKRRGMSARKQVCSIMGIPGRGPNSKKLFEIYTDVLLTLGILQEDRRD